MLETKLTDLLDDAPLSDKIHYFIGDEHLLSQIQSCSLMARRYRVRGHAGIIGILGPVRMDYAYNTVALDLVTDLLEAS